MNIWFPYTVGGSGADVLTETLAAALRERGVRATTQRYAHDFQYAPWLLRGVDPPAKTDIIVANTWNGFAFKRGDVPLVAIQHLLVIDPLLAPYRNRRQALFHHALVRRFEMATHRRADQVVAVSEFTGSRYSELLGVEPPLIIRNGVDTTFFRPGRTARPDAAGRPFRLLFIGNLTLRKGADLIPAVLADLGDAYEFSYTSGVRVKKALLAAANARTLGTLDAEGVRREYERADLLLLPTRLEGLPLVAMEAMACGTPVVASDTASLPEVVTDGKTGILCPVNDVCALANAIRTLRNNPRQLRQFAIEAREDMVRRFSIDRMADEYIELFTRLLSRRKR